MKTLRVSVRMLALVGVLSGLHGSVLADGPRKPIRANPESLDLGTVQLGSSKQLTFTLKNNSAVALAPCSIKAITNKNATTGIVKDLFTVTPASVTLGPGKESTVQVFYTPTQGQAEAFPSGLTAPPTSVTGEGRVEITCGKASDGVGTSVKLKGTVPASPRLRLTVTRKGTLKTISGGPSFVAFKPNPLLCRAESPNFCSSFVLPGTAVRLVAEPAPGTQFVGWSGGTGSAAVCNGKTTLDCSLTLTADSTVAGQ